MSVCTQCGAALGVGRFCVNCGHPVDAPASGRQPDWRTGTAERPAVADDPTPTAPGPVVPPPAPAVAPAPRFPLYADEVDHQVEDDTDLVTAVPAAHGSHVGPRTSESRPAWLPWLLGTLALLLVAGLGTWLLLGGDDETGSPTATDTSSSDRPTDEPTREPSDEPTDEPSEPADGEPGNVARFATATVPATAEPNQDVDGNQVRYEARNMLDGVPETCWRMPGDGTGETLSFDLDRPTTLSSVGLVNGYAKTAREGGTTLDWYAGNRRVLAVEWLFDDGTMVRQDLSETRALQSIDIEEVTTESVQVRLVTVSAPGEGRSARNYTAISEVSFVGVTG